MRRIVCRGSARLICACDDGRDNGDNRLFDFHRGRRRGFESREERALREIQGAVDGGEGRAERTLMMIESGRIVCSRDLERDLGSYAEPLAAITFIADYLASVFLARTIDRRE